MTPTEQPRALHLRRHRAHVGSLAAIYSHSRAYANGAGWRDCPQRLFMRRVAECELGCTVHGVIDGERVAFWRKSEETVMLWVAGEWREIRVRTGWQDAVAWVREVLDG